MRILIRAEGGYKIGMGHVMRMLVLANKLRAFAEVMFVCSDNKEFYGGVKYIEACGYTVLKLDKLRLVDELAKVGGDCLITDSYDVDESYFDSTKAIFNITGYMDDLNKYWINTDFIINQNIYTCDLKYKAAEATKLYLGTQYALLREEFQNLPKRDISNKIENLLITLGGADPQSLSGIVALKLSKAFPEFRIHIIVGPSFIDKGSLTKLAGENIHLHINPKMSELMQKCDVAISACGSTVYELCACGTPTIGIVTADNQVMVASKMDSVGALKYAKEPDELIQQLKNLNFETRVKMSETGQGLVDGYGSIRLSEEIKKIICKT